MRFGATQARRLSTASSVTKPPHFILTTDWVWYWIDEFGSWQEYGKQVSVMGRGECFIQDGGAIPDLSIGVVREHPGERQGSLISG
jgi:hypothetical protein